MEFVYLQTMRSPLFILLIISLFSCKGSSQSGTPKTPENIANDSSSKTDELQKPMTYFEMRDSITIWLKQRVENATKGIKENVEMPFVVRSTGWGCKCPDSYIGVSPRLGDGPWVWPIKPKKFPEVDSVGHSLIVQGYFTGKWVEQDLRLENGEPAEWLYKMPEFKITAWRENKLDYDVPAPFILKN
jgi:hypothetical protein